MISISGELAAVPGGGKRYLATMASHGYEMGVGPAGGYAPHAHRNLVDVLFSPDGMVVLASSATVPLAGRLMVAPPGAWYDPKELGAFWFLKFYTDPARIGVPDKILVDDGSHDGPVSVAGGAFATDFRYVHPERSGRERRLTISLGPAGTRCEVRLDGEVVVTVVP